ncbi:MAG: HEAT repeat domain-containing protein [Planctomycetes bacterium]|nr:HEAT repeat domain-containing protein [Planctomycetota bacterium]
MKRSLLIWAIAAVSAVSLQAGDFAESVKDLGDTIRASSAMQKLAEAGDEAFEDLMDGLKQDPDGEGVNAEEAAKISARRLACARLLGTLGDSRASADLAQMLENQAVESPKYPWFGGACANALGRIWAEKDSSADRDQIIASLKLHAADAKLDNRLRWGCLHGLAALKTGADVAGPIMADDKAPQLLRSAAIEVVVASGDKSSADLLLDIWETQRLGPKGEDGNRTGAKAADYTKPLGVQALFGLASLDDARAVTGLVDVVSMNEFASLDSLRSEAVRVMKDGPLKAEAITALVDTFKDVDKPTQRSRAATTLGEFGAPGVTAFLDIADDEAPKPKEGEQEDKYPADYYAKQVDSNLSQLRSQEALEAFVQAYGDLPAESASLRDKIIDQLLANRNSLKDNSLEVFRNAANDDKLEAPKRAKAINAWAEAKGKESFDDLAKWVTDADGVVRAQAAQNLGRSYIPLAKSKPLLTEVMKDKGEDYAKARENALQGLQRSDDKELLSVFTDSLDPEKETSADVRKTALTALEVYRRTASIDDEDIFPVIEGRLTDPDENVRASAVRVASTMSQVMGNSSKTVEIIEKALADNSKEVRLQAYTQMSLVASDVDVNKVVRAALLEETRDLKGNAVAALNRLSSYGDDNDKQKALVDMALSVMEDRVRENDARSLLGKLAQAEGGLQFTYISDQVRGKIEAATSGDNPNYTRVPALVQTLVAIDDITYMKQIKELANVTDVALRRSCIQYIKEFGTKKDVGFLRELRDKTDSAAPAVTPEIETAIETLNNK